MHRLPQKAWRVYYSCKGIFMEKGRPALNLEEQLATGMAILINLLIAVFFQWSRAWDLFLINCLIILGIGSISLAQKRSQHILMHYVRDWYVVALLLIIYLENRRLIPLINPHDLDLFLIETDRLMFFGHNPTILLEKITCPILTEVFQIIYASFYFLPLSLCLILYRKETPIKFHSAASTILMGFYLSFIGYYLTPAIGPRFTLANQQAFPLFRFISVRSITAHYRSDRRGDEGLLPERPCTGIRFDHVPCQAFCKGLLPCGLSMGGPHYLLHGLPALPLCHGSYYRSKPWVCSVPLGRAHGPGNHHTQQQDINRPADKHPRSQGIGRS